MNKTHRLFVRWAVLVFIFALRPTFGLTDESAAAQRQARLAERDRIKRHHWHVRNPDRLKKEQAELEARLQKGHLTPADQNQIQTRLQVIQTQLKEAAEYQRGRPAQPSTGAQTQN